MLVPLGPVVFLLLFEHLAPHCCVTSACPFKAVTLRCPHAAEAHSVCCTGPAVWHYCIAGVSLLEHLAVHAVPL
jgi:hypothetical protein